jgi:starch synthase
MPSAYEPCGLTQLYAMRNGTIPVARKTGGLADTIVHATPDAILDGRGTGFLFQDYSASAMLGALAQALEVLKSPESWTQLRRNAMAQDFTWDRSAREYTRLYEKVIAEGRP